MTLPQKGSKTKILIGVSKQLVKHFGIKKLLSDHLELSKQAQSKVCFKHGLLLNFSVELNIFLFI